MIKELHLWNKQTAYAYPSPYYPYYWYGPYGPYPWPYRGWYGPHYPYAWPYDEDWDDDWED